MNTISAYVQNYLQGIKEDVTAILHETDGLERDAQNIRLARMGSIAYKILGACVIGASVCAAISAIPLLATGSAVAGITCLAFAALGFVVGHDLATMGINNSNIINTALSPNGFEIGILNHGMQLGSHIYNACTTNTPPILKDTWLFCHVYDMFRKR